MNEYCAAQVFINIANNQKYLFKSVYYYDVTLKIHLRLTETNYSYSYIHIVNSGFKL